MNRSTVQKRLASYEAAQERVSEQRARLRLACWEWKAKGATIVEMAEALGWSRQSVYDLLGNVEGPEPGADAHVDPIRNRT